MLHANAATRPARTAKRPYALHTWRDVLVCVDTGRSSREDYRAIADAALAHARPHPRGIGLIVVVPQNATPPNEEARAGVQDTFDAVRRHLRCVCWVVEGTGFQAGMARAVLTGIRLFQRFPYPTHVLTDLRPGLAWTLAQLHDGPGRAAQVSEAELSILASRMDLGDPAF